MAKLLPSAEVEVRTDRPQPELNSIGFKAKRYGLAVQISAMKDGFRPLRVVDPDPSVRWIKLVTITLREAAHWPARNSDLKAWVAAAQEIRKKGFQVIVIRDALRADEPLEDLLTAPLASVDLNHRARLYSAAVCNLFVNNGPAWFSLALDAPTLIVKPTLSNTSIPCISDTYFRNCGLPPGSQPPCPHQRIAWKMDTAGNILQAFDHFVTANSI
jgi:hypothetical protein